MLVISFVQDFKSACDIWRIHQGAAKWLFKQYLIRPAKQSVSARVKLSSSANLYNEGTLKSYSAVIQFFMMCYTTEDNGAKLDGKVDSLS